MEVFWRHGYKKTSLEDLCEAMGIQRGSFYNTFGSKRDVYLKSLDRFGQMMQSSEMAKSLRGTEGGDALRATCASRWIGSRRTVLPAAASMPRRRPNTRDRTRK